MIDWDVIKFFSVTYVILALATIGLFCGMLLITSVPFIKLCGISIIASSLYWAFAFFMALG